MSNLEPAATPANDSEHNVLPRVSGVIANRAANHPLVDISIEDLVRTKIVPQDFPRTDLGNAQRFVAIFGENVRFCPAWNKWLIWDGVRWCVDDINQIESLAKEVVKAISIEASYIQNIS